ncbi:MAG: ATP-dependent DNA helicase RecG [Syntrophomonadaceae bacterium]|jgi:ATP-dependent DNA helicase RecG
MHRLGKEIRFLKGIGPKRNKLFQRLGIHNIFDLFWYIPRSYFDRSHISPITSLVAGYKVNIQGIITATTKNRARNGMSIIKAIISDETGLIPAVWFNQPFLDSKLPIGQKILISGQITSSQMGKELIVKDYELLDEKTGIKILPIYPLTEGLNQKALRRLVAHSLDEYLDYYTEILPDSIRKHYGLCDIQFAFRNIHFPADRYSYQKARNRLALEELLVFRQVLEEKRKRDRSLRKGTYKETTDLFARVQQGLPFTLTPAQSRVLKEIIQDIESPIVMNRLLQGDVGSGKTVVAVLAMVKAVAGGFQAALMAPTEILADQHFANIDRLLANSGIVIACLTGGTSANQRQMIIEAVRSGEIDILVGTHSLIQDSLAFKNLGLAVIDEQHRFGVEQRLRLRLKGDSPDVLVMTATPIPRTLALTLYGDLDYSVIDELPPGRRKVITRYIPPYHRSQVYNFLKKEIQKGRQAFVVCPLVEESEKQDLQDAQSLYADLQENLFKGFRLGLIHGRMRQADKDLIMQMFKQKQIDLLVTTTVVEVGVDVPNATIMVIEQAERYGLSQLHQLRGRVGRGSERSFCFLLGEPKSEEAKKRLRIIETTSDGFLLAQKDLEMRGPGEFWGVRQHGLDQFKLADLSKDLELIQLSQRLVGSTYLDEQYIFLKNKPNRTIDN